MVDIYLEKPFPISREEERERVKTRITIDPLDVHFFMTYSACYQARFDSGLSLPLYPARANALVLRHFLRGCFNAYGDDFAQGSPQQMAAFFKNRYRKILGGKASHRLFSSEPLLAKATEENNTFAEIPPSSLADFLQYNLPRRAYSHPFQYTVELPVTEEFSERSYLVKGLIDRVFQKPGEKPEIMLIKTHVNSGSKPGPYLALQLALAEQGYFKTSLHRRETPSLRAWGVLSKTYVELEDYPREQIKRIMILVCRAIELGWGRFGQNRREYLRHLKLPDGYQFKMSSEIPEEKAEASEAFNEAFERIIALSNQCRWRRVPIVERQNSLPRKTENSNDHD